MDDVDEEASFPNDDIKPILEQVSIEILENASWDEKMVPLWKNEIIEKVMRQLVDMKLPYKFIVTAMLVQKTDKNLTSACSVTWENNCDGIESFLYPPTRNKDSFNKTIQCLIVVMGVKF